MADAALVVRCTAAALVLGTLIAAIRMLWRPHREAHEADVEARPDQPAHPTAVGCPAQRRIHPIAARSRPPKEEAMPTQTTTNLSQRPTFACHLRVAVAALMLMGGIL